MNSCGMCGGLPEFVNASAMILTISIHGAVIFPHPPGRRLMEFLAVLSVLLSAVGVWLAIKQGRK
jgi:uncharacterized iron-regulated membrane protein